MLASVQIGQYWAGGMDKDYWRLKKREQRAKKREKVVEVKPVPMREEVVKVEWDREKYPDRGAFEVAVARVARARKYAEQFPEFVHASDLKYQDLGWQYEHEGIPAVRKKQTYDMGGSVTTTDKDFVASGCGIKG